jgi:hypothetical protein
MEMAVAERMRPDALGKLDLWEVAGVGCKRVGRFVYYEVDHGWGARNEIVVEGVGFHSQLNMHSLGEISTDNAAKTTETVLVCEKVTHGSLREKWVVHVLDDRAVEKRTFHAAN